MHLATYPLCMGSEVLEPFHPAVREWFRCEPRGPIVVKGVGEMETWFLTGRRTEPAA